MASFGFIGFVVGFVLGMILNAYLLRNLPRGAMRSDKSLQLKYGGLNWAIALGGMALGLYLS